MYRYPTIRSLAHIAFGLAAVLCSAGAIAAEEAGDDISLSLAQLTAAAASYDGKAVIVSGYLSMGFEKHCLCPAPKQAAGKDCVWVSGDGTDWRDLNGQHVTLRGTFGTKFKGHMSCCAGSLRVMQRPVPTPQARATRSH